MSKAYNTRQDESHIVYHDEGKFASVCKTNCYMYFDEKGLFQLKIHRDRKTTEKWERMLKVVKQVMTQTGWHKIQKYDNPICKAMSCFEIECKSLTT